MSTGFESLIRPFQNNDVTPAQTYYNYGQIGVPNIILRFGRGGGGGKTINTSLSLTVTYYCKAYEIETKSL
jgi:hypothetical protein